VTTTLGNHADGAEIAGTFADLAYRIDVSQRHLQMGKMPGGLVMLGIISTAADKAFSAAAKRLVCW